jgi:hypothetical protein
MGMKLITEIFDDPLALITESDSKGVKHLYIQGPFAVAGVKNKNGRIYHPELMEKVIQRYDTDYIKTNRALGELSHPSDRLSVDYERATHLITEMKNDGNGVYIGKAKVLKTPMGKVLEGLLESGVAIGVSTRGAGSLVEANGVKTVGNDFMMTAVDVVSDPSGQYNTNNGLASCFVQGILEGVEFTMNDKGVLVQQEITKVVHEDYNKKRLTEERKLQLFNKFIQEIKG